MGRGISRVALVEAGRAVRGPARAFYPLSAVSHHLSLVGSNPLECGGLPPPCFRREGTASAVPNKNWRAVPTSLPLVLSRPSAGEGQADAEGKGPQRHAPEDGLPREGTASSVPNKDWRAAPTSLPQADAEGQGPQRHAPEDGLPQEGTASAVPNNNWRAAPTSLPQADAQGEGPQRHASKADG